MAAFTAWAPPRLHRTLNGTGKHNETLIAFQLLSALEKDSAPWPDKAGFDASDLYLDSLPGAFHLPETSKCCDIHHSHDPAKKATSEIS